MELSFDKAVGLGPLASLGFDTIGPVALVSAVRKGVGPTGTPSVDVSCSSLVSLCISEAQARHVGVNTSLQEFEAPRRLEFCKCHDWNFSSYTGQVNSSRSDGSSLPYSVTTAGTGAAFRPFR